MANWKCKLNIAEAWRAHEKEEIALTDLAHAIAKEIQSSDARYFITPLGLAELFESFNEDEWDDDWTAEEEFSSLMAQLYDWGNTVLDATWSASRMCWIDTTRVD